MFELGISGFGHAEPWLGRMQKIKQLSVTVLVSVYGVHVKSHRHKLSIAPPSPEIDAPSSLSHAGTQLKVYAVILSCLNTKTDT